MRRDPSGEPVSLDQEEHRRIDEPPLRSSEAKMQPHFRRQRGPHVGHELERGAGADGDADGIFTVEAKDGAIATAELEACGRRRPEVETRIDHRLVEHGPAMRGMTEWYRERHRPSEHEGGSSVHAHRRHHRDRQPLEQIGRRRCHPWRSPREPRHAQGHTSQQQPEPQPHTPMTVARSTPRARRIGRRRLVAPRLESSREEGHDLFWRLSPLYRGLGEVWATLVGR